MVIPVLKGPHVLLEKNIVLGQFESVALEGFFQLGLMEFQNFFGHRIFGDEGGFDLVMFFLDLNHQASQFRRLQGEADDSSIVPAEVKNSCPNLIRKGKSLGG